jgi:hypothetical protein
MQKAGEGRPVAGMTSNTVPWELLRGVYTYRFVRRYLELQMQITADGFVAGPNGELDWAMGKMDDKLLEFINHLVDTSDTILLGRKMAPGFISYWEREVAKPGGPQYPFARRWWNYRKSPSARRSAPWRDKTCMWRTAISGML